MNANDIIGMSLVAQKEIPVFSNDGGFQIATMKKGETTPPIFSWVKNDDA